VLRRVLEYRMTVAEWIGAAVLAGAPYLVIGVALLLVDHRVVADTDSPRRVLATLGAVLFWPVLLLAHLC
jgi:hypothetical protein